MVFCEILLKKRVHLFKNEKAFTLIEISVVLSMLSIIAMLVYPQFNGLFDDIALEQAANQLASDIQYIKQKSVANDGKGLPKILISSNENCYYIYEKSYKIEKKIDLAEKHNNRVEILGYNGTLNEISFNYLGTPTHCGTVAIHNNNNGKTKYVIVSPVIGRIRVDDTPPSSWKYSQ